MHSNVEAGGLHECMAEVVVEVLDSEGDPLCMQTLISLVSIN